MSDTRRVSRERADAALSSALGDILAEIEVMHGCTFTEDDTFRWSGQLVNDLMAATEEQT